MKHPRPAHAGFTLVEMAVVLAIIGVLTGGVLVGQYMIRRTEIQDVSIQFAKYKTAYNNFKTQFSAIPGDMNDAEDFWGTDAVTGTCAAPTPAAGDRVPKKATCNGNGDGDIQGSVSQEWHRAWQHMANSGVIEGAYSGVAGSGGTDHVVPGQNSPAGRLTGSGYALRTIGAQTGNTLMFAGNYGKTISFGSATSASHPASGALTAREASGIDIKIDDGAPGTGILLTYASALNANCTTSDTAATSAYKLTEKGKNCALIYVVE